MRSATAADLAPRAEATRARILNAATELFSEGGYEGTSTRALGAAAQANIATIAYHFGDKEGLYHAVLQRAYAGMLELDLPDALPKDASERIRRLVEAVFYFARERSDEVRLMLRHVLKHGSLPNEIRASGTAQLFERLDSVRGALGLPDLSSYRMELLSLNHLIVRYAVSDLADVATLTGDLDPTEAVVRHLGDVAVQLLGAAPGPGPLQGR